MMPGMKSPMQELDQEMAGPQAQPVHHTGPGGPREKLSQEYGRQKGYLGQISPMAKGGVAARSTIMSNMNKLRGIITDQDIVHILKAKGMDDMQIKQLLGQAGAGMQDVQGDPTMDMEAVQNEAAQKGLGIGSQDIQGLQQDIRRGAPTASPLR